MVTPRVLIFDAIETVFSLEPVRDALGRIGAPDHALDVWFARLLRDAFALSAAGGYATFPRLARGSFATVLGDLDLDPSADDVDGVLAVFGELPAHADARPAMEVARERGVPVHLFTNGDRAATENLVARNGLDDLVDVVTTVHDIRRWKPAREAYAHAVDRAGVEPDEAGFVAVHAWDVCGARSTGLRTGWCSRLEHVLSPPLGPADVEAGSLVEVVRGVLELH